MRAPPMGSCGACASVASDPASWRPPTRTAAPPRQPACWRQAALEGPGARLHRSVWHTRLWLRPARACRALRTSSLHPHAAPPRPDALQPARRCPFTVCILRRRLSRCALVPFAVQCFPTLLVPCRQPPLRSAHPPGHKAIAASPAPSSVPLPLFLGPVAHPKRLRSEPRLNLLAHHQHYTAVKELHASTMPDSVTTQSPSSHLGTCTRRSRRPRYEVRALAATACCCCSISARPRASSGCRSMCCRRCASACSMRRRSATAAMRSCGPGEQDTPFLHPPLHLWQGCQRTQLGRSASDEQAGWSR